jgi:hypothetical protein
MKTSVLFLGVLFCLALGHPQAQASNISICPGPSNVVENCGFDTGDFSSWTLTGNDTPFELGNLYGVEATDPIDGIGPHSGNYQAFFGDLDANATTVSQTLQTVAGSLYTVSFWLAQDTAPLAPYTNMFAVSFAGNVLASQTGVPVEGYTFYSYTGSASSASSVVSFTLGNDLGEFLLDDVTVSATAPEPGSWLLLAGGLGAAIFKVRGRLRYDVAGAGRRRSITISRGSSRIDTAPTAAMPSTTSIGTA